MELGNIKVIVDIVKIYFICLFTYYLNLKFLNHKISKNIKKITVIYMSMMIISLICKVVKESFGFLYGVIGIGILVSLLFSVMTKNRFKDSLVITVISLSINYSLFSISISIVYGISNMIKIENEYTNLGIMVVIYFIFLYTFSKIRRLKKGISFLQTKLKDGYLNLVILNISSIILFIIVISSNYKVKITGNFIIGLLFFSIIMFISIQKSLQLYYKQQMLIQDLKETKEELERKKQEIEELEKENLNFSKISHSIAHKQKSLEYKINQLLLKNEIANEIDLRDRVKKVTKELQQQTKVELAKTNIPEIDDMLAYMQAECYKNKIDFQIQLNGNIYYMINHEISKEKLEILLADHIKNAIIAIEHSNNSNKSILVRLGEIEGVYSLYIYDSGVEFDKEVLANLSKKPITTHADEGGTGMGFMNTFDTLKQCQASIIIQEYGKPCQDNFTKVIQIKFDKKDEFRIFYYEKKE